MILFTIAIDKENKKVRLKTRGRITHLLPPEQEEQVLSGSIKVANGQQVKAYADPKRPFYILAD